MENLSPIRLKSKYRPNVVASVANRHVSGSCAIHRVLFSIVQLSNIHCEQSGTSQPLQSTCRCIHRLAKYYHTRQRSLINSPQTADFNSAISNGIIQARYDTYYDYAAESLQFHGYNSIFYNKNRFMINITRFQ